MQSIHFSCRTLKAEEAISDIFNTLNTLLVYKKFINNKYGRRSIMKLKLFFFKQGLRPRRSKQLKFRRLIYTKKFRYQHLSSIQKIKSLGLRK